MNANELLKEIAKLSPVNRNTIAGVAKCHYCFYGYTFDPALEEEPRSEGLSQHDTNCLWRKTVEHVYSQPPPSEEHPQTEPNNHCPKCDSTFLSWCPIDMDDLEAYQEVYCNTCDTEWINYYKWDNRVYVERDEE